VRGVARMQLSSYWALRWLTVPEVKWLITNSVHSPCYTSAPACLRDPPSNFSKGLVLRPRTEAGRVDQESIEITL